MPPPPLDFNLTASDNSYLSAPLSPPTTSGPQADNLDKPDRDEQLRRRIEFLGLKPEQSEEYKKVKEGRHI